MHMVICLDDRNGMLFNGRRLSSDKAVCSRIREKAQGRLWMNAYSAKLFEKILDGYAQLYISKCNMDIFQTI